MNAAEQVLLELIFPAENGELDFVSLTEFQNKFQAEWFPEDPPVSIEHTRRAWSSIPSVVTRRAWAVKKTGDHRLLGLGHINYLNLEENKHMAECSLGVLLEYRRRGLASRLLWKMAVDAQENGRRILMCGTTDRIPAGEAFAAALRAKEGLVTHVNQLQMEDIDLKMLKSWQNRGSERAIEYKLDLWEGRYPDDKLEAVARLKQAMNEAPTGTLDIDDIQYTPDILRQIDDQMEARGMRRWCFYVSEVESGSLAGFTEIIFIPSKPEIAIQGDTAVLKQYRNLGLGRWIKAAMLEKILHDCTEVKLVRTTNAYTNEAMLKINRELGFKHYEKNSFWQVGVIDLLEILAIKYPDLNR
jgi:mycothiol synthase